jgi:hypothetical protein
MELDRLKRDALKELTDLEARANTKPLSAQELSKAVEWFDDSTSQKITGVLLRVDCVGKQLRLNVKDDGGKTQSLSVSDPGQFEIKGGESLVCGAQKARRVTVFYKSAAQGSKPGAKSGAEATGLEFEP